MPANDEKSNDGRQFADCFDRCGPADDPVVYAKLKELTGSR